jgi:3,4-dihydroxy 2-butanone 4-phosphate synthase/GTP cyclohydrolase II
MSTEAINRVKQAIEDMKNGKMVIMIDDEDRENEGDLVYAATFTTPQKVNFMATHAKGLICVPLSTQIANRLSLNPMVNDNECTYETAFTISVDAASCSTGISAYERNETIKVLSDYKSRALDLVRPGHIFPLIAKEGGTLVRVGHTEGSVDLCKMAGLSQSAVICEIMKDDGTMARRDDLDLFSKEHELNIVYISDIVEYRSSNESLVKRIYENPIQFLGHDVQQIVYQDHDGNTHTVFAYGKVNETTNVKFRSVTTDLNLLTDKDRYDLLISSAKYMEKNGGVIIYMSKPNKDNPYMKEYGLGAQILRDLSVKNINLLTKKKVQEFVGLQGFGLNIIKLINPNEA